jgi:hypothetical protein
MRRRFALVLTISSLALGGTAGLGAPAALAAGSATTAAAGSTTAAGTSTSAAASSTTAAGASTSSAVSQASNPTANFGLGNAESNATSQTNTSAANNTSSATSTSGSGGLSGFDAVLIGVIVVLVLVGISFWVWYDARSNVAQLRHGGGAASDPMFSRSHPGSKAAAKPRKPKPAERKRRKRGRAR